MNLNNCAIPSKSNQQMTSTTSGKELPEKSDFLSNHPICTITITPNQQVTRGDLRAKSQGKTGFKTKWPRAHSGFTITEVIVVITVIAIMATIGTPAIMSWLPNLYFRDASQNLYLDMQLVKTEAIKRNANVVITFDKVACGGSIPGDGGGYTIFVDDGNGTGTADDDTQNGTEETLRNVSMPKNVAICSSTFAGDLLAYLPTGFPKGGNTGLASIENARERQADLTVNITGAVSLNIIK